MRRVFWIALGATVGILVVRRLSRTAEAYTPAGLAEGLREIGDTVLDFIEDVRSAMAEREVALHHALGLDEQVSLPAGPSAAPTSGVH